MYLCERIVRKIYHLSDKINKRNTWEKPDEKWKILHKITLDKVELNTLTKEFMLFGMYVNLMINN